jgi:hypothetical protein
MAIARGAVTAPTTNSTTSYSFTATVTGANTIGIVVAHGVNNITNPFYPDWNTPTWGGVNMTLIETAQLTDGSLGWYATKMWYLKGVTTGTVSISNSVAIHYNYSVMSTSYTGVDQTTPIGGHSNNSGLTTSITTNVTVGAATSWVVGGGSENNGATMVGANDWASKFCQNNDGDLGVLDTNGVVAGTGSRTFGITNLPAAEKNLIVALEIAAAAAVANGNFLPLLASR